jgi:diacylglycerol kinase (ATP)
MKENKRILLIYNPNARSGKSAKHVDDIVEFFRKHDVWIDTIETSCQGDATVQAAKNQSDYDLIIAGGGDGTINEVINGIMAEKDKTKRAKLSIIPLGTENVLAHELNIPNNPLKACKQILKGKAMNVDLGCAYAGKQERYFILTAGIGFDAHVAHTTHAADPLFKNLLGSGAYVLTAIKELFNYKAQKMKITIDGITYPTSFVIVGNVKWYGKKNIITPEADIHDGLLDVFILQSDDVLNFIKFLFGLLVTRHDFFEDVIIKKAKKLRVESPKPVLAHVDCEALGKTPVDIEVCADALEIVC